MWTACRPLALGLPGRVSVNLELVLVTLALMAVIVIGIATILWVDRWRKRSVQPPPGDELHTFRTLFEQGLLSAEEFERIRGRMEKGSRANPPVSSTAVKAIEPAAGKESITPATPPLPRPNGSPDPG